MYLLSQVAVNPLPLTLESDLNTSLRDEELPSMVFDPDPQLVESSWFPSYTYMIMNIKLSAEWTAAIMLKNDMA